MGSKMKWPDKNEIDGETMELINIVENGWDWNWPGWEWVASALNREYCNNRSASSCRNKYERIMIESQKQAEKRKGEA